jgi:hypothetical protein
MLTRRNFESMASLGGELRGCIYRSESDVCGKFLERSRYRSRRLDGPHVEGLALVFRSQALLEPCHSRLLSLRNASPAKPPLPIICPKLHLFSPNVLCS